MSKPSKLFICGRNMVDLAVLTALGDGSPPADGSVATLPVDNLQLSAREYMWRWTEPAEVTIRLTWEASLSERLNFVALARHNLEGASQWQIKCYSTYDWTGTPVYDSGEIDAFESDLLGELDWGVEELGASDEAFLNQRMSVHYFVENAEVVNSMEIIIKDPGNSAGYIEASRLFVGRGIEMMLGAASGSLTWEENTDQVRTDGGSLQSDGTIGWRDLEVEANIDSSQRAELMDTFRIAGKLRDTFVALYPDADDGTTEGAELHRDYTIIGRFKDKPRVTSNPDQEQAQIFQTRMSFTEI